MTYRSSRMAPTGTTTPPHTPTLPRSRARRTLIIACAALPFWAFALLLAWPDRPYRIDLLANFVPHFALAIGLLAVLLTIPRRTRITAPGIASAAVALALWHLAHCSPPAPATPTDRTIRVVHFNAHSERSANDTAFLAWLRDQDTDLVCLVETPWSFAAMHPWVRERYPYRVEPSMGLQWPNLLLSKHPLALKEMEADDPDHLFSFVARRSVTVSVPGAAPFIWTALHPPSPRRESSWRRALDEATRDAAILARHRALDPTPILVTADFNAAPTARLLQHFTRVSELTAWTPRLAAGTWPSNLSPWLAVPIDRPATTPELRVTSLTVGPRFRSDHRPIAFTLALTPAPETRPNPGISEPPTTPAR